MKSVIRLILFIGMIASLSGPVHAAKPINTTFTGVAIKGYDPVAYFTDGKPVKGDSDISWDWNGATWRFASTAHRDLFKASPDKYAPQYGGYCAWAVSRGYTAGIDPEAWRIVDDRLYLNYSKTIQAQWLENIPENIRLANESWPKLLSAK